MGGLFNIKGVEKIKYVQKVAVENSRLKIPLIFGMDVIHGYKTGFPIPIGLSCSWDMEAIEKSARVAATEASAEGICWTFSPMYLAMEAFDRIGCVDQVTNGRVVLEVGAQFAPVVSPRVDHQRIFLTPLLIQGIQLPLGLMKKT